MRLGVLFLSLNLLLSPVLALKCNICGEGNIIGDPTGTVVIPIDGIDHAQDCIFWQDTEHVSEEFCETQMLAYTMYPCRCMLPDGRMLEGDEEVARTIDEYKKQQEEKEGAGTTVSNKPSNGGKNRPSDVNKDGTSDTEKEGLSGMKDEPTDKEIGTFDVQGDDPSDIEDVPSLSPVATEPPYEDKSFRDDAKHFFTTDIGKKIGIAVGTTVALSCLCACFLHQFHKNKSGRRQ